MATQTLPDIHCPACGRHFKSKPEWLGKKAHCLCGQTLDIPLPPPPQPQSQSDDDEGLYDLLPVAEAPDAPIDLPPAPVVPHTATSAHASRTTAPHAPPTRLPPGLAAYPGIPAPRPAPPPPERAREIKKMLIPLAAVCLLAGLIIGARFLFVSAKAPTQALPGDDGRVAQVTDEYGAYEAREWLTATHKRGIIGAFWTREKAIKMVDQWYAEGAKKVLAFGGMLTSSLAIELPDAGPQRKAFIDYAERWRQEHHFDRPPIKDVHQKYVMIDFL